MISSSENQAAVVSSLVDIRDVPLDELADMAARITECAILRILPESSVAPVPVAAFQSAI
jgi:FXSXX-COOH protein